jgi:hypothetical protein
MEWLFSGHLWLVISPPTQSLQSFATLTVTSPRHLALDTGSDEHCLLVLTLQSALSSTASSNSCEISLARKIVPVALLCTSTKQGLIYQSAAGG